MTPPRPRLRVESLEDRTVPTALGSPWPDPATLTLSFAADGTKVGRSDSTLFKTMSGVASDAAWQREVLRAFQTWAVQTNVNIGLVADGGAAFGSPGDIQGDHRAGDIRVGAVALSKDSLANASPFDWRIGTWSGDVVFNTKSRFGVGSDVLAVPDLFSIALHEAGHVFGLEHSDDPTSALSERYTGRKAGPNAADVAAIQSYYGTRNPDRYEGLLGNGTLLTATPLALSAVTGTARAVADVRDRSDADTYWLPVGGLLGPLAVRVKTSGVSLLAPKVTVHDGWGRVVASAAAGPGWDVEVSAPRVLLNTGYYVRVTGATADVFGVGGYELTVARTDGVVLPDAFLGDGGLNDTPLGAVPLEQVVTGTKDSYAFNGVLESRTDTDYYTVVVPRTTDASERAMVVTVGQAAGKAHPDVAVFDALLRPVAYKVLNNDGPTLSIQVLGARRGGTYLVRVTNPASGADATGNYRLRADFQAPTADNLRRLEAGQLGPGVTEARGSLTVKATRLFEFALDTRAEGKTGATLTFTVRDSAGRAVLTLTKGANDPAVNRSLYLPEGTYTTEVRMSVPAGEEAPRVSYRVYLGVMSDPAGPYAPGTTSSDPNGSSGDSGYTYSSTPPPDGSGDPTWYGNGSEEYYTLY